MENSTEQPKSEAIHITDWAEVSCGSGALSELFGVRPETITRMAKVEGMPKSARGKYLVIECVEWLIARERDKGGRETPADKKARMEVAKEQALRYRIDNAKQLGELIPASVVQAAVNQMASNIASQLDGLAPRMAAELASIDDPATIQRALFNECRDIRTATATTFATIADSINGGPDIEAATEQERGRVGEREQNITA